MAKRVRRRGRARGHVELREDVAHVAVDGLLAEREVGGDLSVRAAGRDEPQNLELALREAARGRGCRRRARTQRVDVRDIGRGFEALESRTRRVELERRAVLIAERAARGADRYARSGRVIRRAQVL